jgi:hypothetical protein
LDGINHFTGFLSPSIILGRQGKNLANILEVRYLQKPVALIKVDEEKV